MKKDYADLAKKILQYVGGKDNITFVMHCATRLRFTLKDIDKADTKSIKELKGVIDVILKMDSIRFVSVRMLLMYFMN